MSKICLCTLRFRIIVPPRLLIFWNFSTREIFIPTPWWWYVGRRGVRSAKKKKWRNAANNTVETINLCPYNNEKNYPLRPIFGKNLGLVSSCLKWLDSSHVVFYSYFYIPCDIRLNFFSAPHPPPPNVSPSVTLRVDSKGWLFCPI